MIRVVLDTNILVSAILSPAGPAAQILRLEKEGHLDLVFSPDALQEHLRVLRYPKIKKLLEKRNVTLETVVNFLKRLAKVSILAAGKTKIDAVKDDSSDNIFLACAVEGRADFVVSGDRHLKDPGEFQGIPIVEPAGFLKTVSNFDHG